MPLYKLSALETQKVDLTNYVTNTDYATSDTGGVVKVSTSNGFSMTNGALRASTLTYSTYQSAANNTNIGKATLENVITGKGLVSNTDYATSSTGGVVKVSQGYGIAVSSTGSLYGATKTYQQYNDSTNGLIISKGTFENTLTGKGLNSIVTLTQTEYNNLSTKDPDTYYYIVEE